MSTARRASRLVSWLKEQINESGAKGCVLGMSGGIDSSVVAALCQQAFPQNTLGLIMPCHSNPEDKEHALLVADRLGIPTREAVLDGIYDNLLTLLPDFQAAPANLRMAQANLKPRLRMLTLYHTANQLNYLVVGSGNRSELAIGYFTKYGDSGVDILPLANLVKKEVRELAAFLGIPPPIIDKAPSAGLWTGQTDEGEMGFSYEVLDRYLLAGEALPGIKSRIETMMASSRHKRSLPPMADFRE